MHAAVQPCKSGSAPRLILTPPPPAPPPPPPQSKYIPRNFPLPPEGCDNLAVIELVK